MPLALALPRPAARWFRALGAMFVVSALLLGPLAVTTQAASTVKMEAKVLLQGHARVGSWMAIQIAFSNDGPAVKGEVRLAGGASGRTRFSVPVDLPTNSRQAYILHAQPPSFGRSVKIELISGGNTIGSAISAAPANNARCHAQCPLKNTHRLRAVSINHATNVS